MIDTKNQRNEFLKNCLEVRLEALELFSRAGRGHLPSSFSIVEILVTLYLYVMRYSKEHSLDQNRDRFMLSKGHGVLSYYAILAKIGTIKEQDKEDFCLFSSHLGGHPSRNLQLGIEASSGSLGMTPSYAVGVAYHLKRINSPAHVYVLVGDGECAEGAVWESIISAAKNKISNITFLVDENGYQSYGKTSDVSCFASLHNMFNSFGCNTSEVDLREDPFSLVSFFREHKNKGDKPGVIICKTTKGMGSSFLIENPSWHHKINATPEEIQIIRESVIHASSST